jgi:hypothetical protein
VTACPDQLLLRQLMVVAFLPFASSVLADALRDGHGE